MFYSVFYLFSSVLPLKRFFLLTIFLSCWQKQHESFSKQKTVVRFSFLNFRRKFLRLVEKKYTQNDSDGGKLITGKKPTFD